MFPRVFLCCFVCLFICTSFQFFFLSDLRPQLYKQFCKRDNSKKNPRASLEKLFESWKYWLLRVKAWMWFCTCLYRESANRRAASNQNILPCCSPAVILQQVIIFKIQPFWVWGSGWFSPVYLKNDTLNWGIYCTWQGLH